jgi:hypothetical protein
MLVPTLQLWCDVVLGFAGQLSWRVAMWGLASGGLQYGRYAVIYFSGNSSGACILWTYNLGSYKLDAYDLDVT